MQLSTEELIRFAIVTKKNVMVNITEGGKISITEKLPPSDHTSHIIKDVLLGIYLQGGTAYLGFDGYNFVIYKKPTVPIILNTMEFIGWNRKGTPIIKIDGEELSGYNAISKKLYGTTRQDIAVILKPYLSKEFDPSKLKLLENKTYRGRTYPIFMYGDSKKTIKGIKGLKSKFPQLTEEYLSELVAPSEHKPRHLELIAKYDLELSKKGYIAADPNNPQLDLSFKSKTSLVEWIKSQGESVSRETAKRIFEQLERKV